MDMETGTPVIAQNGTHDYNSGIHKIIYKPVDGLDKAE